MLKLAFNNKEEFKKDIIGGSMTTAFALPVLLALGEQSGLGAMSGLWGAIVLGLVSAALGATPTQISGPTGSMVVVTAVIIASQVTNYGSLEAAMGTVIAILLLAGILLYVFGLFNIARYIRYMPYPVISGFRSGIGFILIVLQIFPAIGVATYISPENLVATITVLQSLNDVVNYHALGLFLITLLFIYLAQMLLPKWPRELIILVLLSVFCHLLQWDVPTIFASSLWFPADRVAALGSVYWGNSMNIFIAALTLALLASIDSVMTSVVAGNFSKDTHDNNRDLMALGLGNIAISLLGGVPGAGAVKRTVVNINAGGKTRISVFFHVGLLLVIAVFAESWLVYMPLPVIAAILVSVGIGMIDFKAFRHLLQVPKADAVTMLMVLVMTVFVDLLQAIGVGMVLAALLFMKKMADISERLSTQASIADLSKDETWPDEMAIPLALQNKIVIYHFDGPLFFGFAAKIQSIISSCPEVKAVILRLHRVPYMDQSGLYAIEDAVMSLHKKGITVYITGIQEQPRDMLQGIDLIPGVISNDAIFTHFEDCVHTLQSRIA